MKGISPIEPRSARRYASTGDTFFGPLRQPKLKLWGCPGSGERLEPEWRRIQGELSPHDRRRRQPVLFAKRLLTWRHSDFSVHNRVRVKAGDAEGKKQLAWVT